MTEDLSELMMAAIAAVITVTQADTTDPAQSARQAGSAWSQDHRRQVMGQPTLMRARNARSPWR